MGGDLPVSLVVVAKYAGRPVIDDGPFAHARARPGAKRSVQSPTAPIPERFSSPPTAPPGAEPEPVEPEPEPPRLSSPQRWQRPPRFAPDVVELVRRLYLTEHLSQTTIAARIGRSQNYVSMLMKKAEIPTRPSARGRGRAAT